MAIEAERLLRDAMDREREAVYREAMWRTYVYTGSGLLVGVAIGWFGHRVFNERGSQPASKEGS